jgi:hypothetical protein
MPSVFGGALFGSALSAVGLRNFVSSTRPWPSGVRIIAMSDRTPSSPMRRSTQRPSTCASPLQDNVGVVVDDLAAAVAFFKELGLELRPRLPSGITGCDDRYRERVDGISSPEPRRVSVRYAEPGTPTESDRRTRGTRG